MAHDRAVVDDVESKGLSPLFLRLSPSSVFVQQSLGLWVETSAQGLELVLALPGLPAASAWAAGALGKGMMLWHGQEDPGCTHSVMAEGGLETPGPGCLTWIMVCNSC